MSIHDVVNFGGERLQPYRDEQARLLLYVPVQ